MRLLSLPRRGRVASVARRVGLSIRVNPTRLASLGTLPFQGRDDSLLVPWRFR
jgi:hypothetical protein